MKKTQNKLAERFKALTGNEAPKIGSFWTCPGNGVIVKVIGLERVDEDVSVNYITLWRDRLNQDIPGLGSLHGCIIGRKGYAFSFFWKYIGNEVKSHDRWIYYPLNPISLGILWQDVNHLLEEYKSSLTQ